MSQRRSNLRSSTSATASKNKDMGGNSLLNREEEYMRLNRELEAKTASLLEEADLVMREADTPPQRPQTEPLSLFDNVSADDLLHEYNAEIDALERSITKSSALPPTKASKPRRTKHMRTTSANKLGGAATRASRASAVDDVALPDETEFLSGLRQAVSNIEQRAGDETGPGNDVPDDVLPEMTSELGLDVQIRFLKAKLRVMQEELDKMSDEINMRDNDVSALQKKLKESEEEQSRLQKTTQSQQIQMNKYKKISEEAKTRADGLDTQLSALKRELDSLKRQQKQQTSNQSATEVRLNRALEDVEKYKLLAQKAKSSSKESSGQDKKRIEQLVVENKKLEKQKTELLAGFRKQLKLIEVLKRQKMHIEAAQLLKFTEEEFMRALDWEATK